MGAAPDAGKVIVATNIDFCADCKPAQLESTIKMIVALHKARKVTNADIEAAMTDMVEFIDSFMHDNPRIFDYVGDMFCSFANNNILTTGWLCDVTSRVMENSCKQKVIAGAMKSVKKEFGNEAVKDCFGGPSDRSALEGLLGPAFADLANEFL